MRPAVLPEGVGVLQISTIQSPFPPFAWRFVRGCVCLCVSAEVFVRASPVLAPARARVYDGGVYLPSPWKEPRQRGMETFRRGANGGWLVGGGKRLRAAGIRRIRRWFSIRRRLLLTYRRAFRMRVNLASFLHACDDSSR